MQLIGFFALVSFLAPAMAQTTSDSTTMASESLATKPLKLHLKAHNTKQRPPASYPFTFEIAPRTDLWRKPPITFSDTQPTFYTSLRLQDFASASLNFTIAPEILYDQAGIAVLFPGREERWVKAGLEYEPDLGGLKKSVVAAREWSDWNVVGSEDGKNVNVVVERIIEKGKKGPSLVVRIQGEIIREVTWVFAQDKQTDGVDEVWVGIYGARPADVEESLKVQIKSFSVNVWDDRRDD